MEGRLLLAKPEFCGSILDVQAKIYDLKQVRGRKREREKERVREREGRKTCADKPIPLSLVPNRPKELNPLETSPTLSLSLTPTHTHLSHPDDWR